jgi:hypothetical protein
VEQKTLVASLFRRRVMQGDGDVHADRVCDWQPGRFSKIRDFHIVNAAQRSHLQKQVADVREGFKMMQFGGGDDRVQNGHSIARRLTADELPVLSPNGEHEPSRRIR